MQLAPAITVVNRMDHQIVLKPTISTADRCTIWKNHAIDDTSMKFGTWLGYALRKIFGYRAIADFSHNKNGGFSKMAAKTITFDHLETQVFAFY